MEENEPKVQDADVAVEETDVKPPITIFAITTPNLKLTGRISFKFMFDSEVPYNDIRDYNNVYGFIMLRDRDEKDINFFKAVRGEPDDTDPNTKRWEIHLFESSNFKLAGGVDESEDEAGLQKILKDIDTSCVILMQRDIFDRFEAACKAVGVDLKHFHSEKDLSTT